MSLDVFENTNLDFDVTLIKLDRRFVKGKIEDVIDNSVPVPANAILSLDINESSLTMGAKGSITIINTLNIFEQLGISAGSPNDLYVAIKIIDTDLTKADIDGTDKVITVLGLVSSTAAASGNIVDNILTFNWEEAFVAATRKTQLRVFTNLVNIPNRERWSAIELADDFHRYLYKLRSGDTVTTKRSFSPDVKHDLKVAENTESPTVYEAIQKLVSESKATSLELSLNALPFSDGATGKVPYFRFVNEVVDGEVKRKLKFDAFLTDRHIEFINAVAQGDEVGDYSDVWLEKFNIGPFSPVKAAGDPNLSLYNKIETYNVTRADVAKLRETTWGDYHFYMDNDTPDPAIINSVPIQFAELQADFVNYELNGVDVDVNLALLDPREIKEFHVPINTISDNELAAEARKQAKNSISNKVHKSILTINDTISFTSKGSVIRQPNKFIWIERGVEEADYKKLWYVNSVTHNFKDGKYTTTIIATKIFGDTALLAVEANKQPRSVFENTRPDDGIFREPVSEERIAEIDAAAKAVRAQQPEVLAREAIVREVLEDNRTLEEKNRDRRINRAQAQKEYRADLAAGVSKEDATKAKVRYLNDGPLAVDDGYAYYVNEEGTIARRRRPGF
jgi:hypothetical protein